MCTRRLQALYRQTHHSPHGVATGDTQANKHKCSVCGSKHLSAQQQEFHTEHPALLYGRLTQQARNKRAKVLLPHPAQLHTTQTPHQVQKT